MSLGLYVDYYFCNHCTYNIFFCLVILLYFHFKTLDFSMICFLRRGRSRNGHKCPRRGRPRRGRPCVDLMSPSRTSPCGHKVPAEDVPIEDVPVEDITSAQRHVLAEDVPGKDIMSAQGRPCTDVLVEDICVRFYFCPFVVFHFKAEKMHPPTILLFTICS